MKSVKYHCFFITLLLVSCAPDPNHANRGAQSSQDYPSNRNTEVSEKDSSTQITSDSISSEAPNNGNANPHQTIQGQTGTNQTGK